MAENVVAEVVEPQREKSLAEQLPRLPPIEAADALKTFQLEHGFELELIAAEPLVGDPVDACFDEQGRMFVAEFHAYPYALEKDQIIPAGRGRTTTGIVRMLEDLDNDGVMDRSTVFADGLDWPLAVVPYDGGIFLIDVPDVLYLKDTDGDGVADVRKLVYSNLGRDNVQGVANNMKWGLNNRIWVASGSNGGSIVQDGQELLKIGRHDWSFDPLRSHVSLETGGVQFGHSMDDWGNRFLCSNSDHIVHVAIENRYLERNPYSPFPRVLRSIAKEGAAARVFRQSPLEPWRIVRTARRVADPKFDFLPETERVPGGYFTSASGITIYRGNAYPEEFHGNAFIGDVGSNLVHRKTLENAGVSFLATRADQQTEFITSKDTWFRPVNYVNAPDGSLYLLDMYRETIEHPFSIPEDIRAHLDLESGNDRGRIYRIKSPGMQRATPIHLGILNPTELVNQLASGNSWNRETAQRLIFERQNPNYVPVLKEFLKTTSEPLGKLHSFYALQGLNALDAELIVKGLTDEHPRIREHAVRLSEPLLEADHVLSSLVIERLHDVDVRVQFHALLALGWMQPEQAQEGLSQGLHLARSQSDLQSAFLISVRDQGGEVFSKALQSHPTQVGESIELLEKIANMVGARPEQEQVDLLLAELLNPQTSPEFVERFLLSLQKGLNQRGTSLAKLIKEDASNGSRYQMLSERFETSAKNSVDDSLPLPTRINAVRILGLAPWELVETAFESLLLPSQSQELQLVTVETLKGFQEQSAADLLLRNWSSLTPQMRMIAVDVFLARAEFTVEFLKAIREGIIQKSGLDAANVALLLKHPNAEIRNQANEIFSREALESRSQIIAEFLPALELLGEPANGKLLFQKHCSACHLHEQVGKRVGPDLSSVQNKTPHDLLVAILDPNREFQINYTNYSIITQDGRVFTGMITNESAVSLTLKGAEAIEVVVQRDQIEALVSSGVSLMPEGLEKTLDHQQLADLIAYIRLVAPATEN